MNTEEIKNAIRTLKIEGLRRKDLITQKLHVKVKEMESMHDEEYRHLLSELQRILYAIKALDRFDPETKI